MSMKNERLFTLLTFIASFFWGTSFVASRICLDAGMLKFEIVFYRMLIGVVGMALIFHKELHHFSRAAVKTGLMLGCINMMIYTLEMYGITMVETSKASFLTSTNIIIMPFLSALVMKTSVRMKSFAAALVAITGVGILSLTGNISGGFEPGAFLLLGAAVGYAMNTLAVARFGSGASSIQITFLQLTITMGYSGVMTLLQGHNGVTSLPAMGALAYLAIGPTLICFLIKNHALKFLSPMKCTLILATEGIFCAVASVIMLHNTITPRIVLGSALILSAIMIEEFGDHKRMLPKEKS